jgi:hypothetical protein
MYLTLSHNGWGKDEGGLSLCVGSTCVFVNKQLDNLCDVNHEYMDRVLFSLISGTSFFFTHLKGPVYKWMPLCLAYEASQF